jgi:hypothetical protein
MSIGNYNLKDFATGFALGLAGKPFPLPQGEKEPVAYLYGHVATEGETPTHTINGVGYVGVVLPKLPTSDCEYAVIAVNDSGVYSVFFSSAVSSINSVYLVFSNRDTYYRYAFVDGGWTYRDTNTGPVAVQVSPIWANYDVRYGGSGAPIVVAKSDPVPVYE